MLEEQDIKQIRTAVKEEIGVIKEGVDELGEAIQALSSHMDAQIADAKQGFGSQIGQLRSDLIEHVTRTVK